MQPKSLQMKNFGPFIDEKLDFSQLQAGGLFLISGKTGAGKTTIFDGMGESALRQRNALDVCFTNRRDQRHLYF